MWMAHKKIYGHPAQGAVQFETRGSRSANFGNLHDFCLQFYTCRQLQILYISLCLIVHYMHIFETAMCILKIEINQEAKLPLGPNRTAPDLKSNLQCLHSTQLAPSFLLAAGGTQEVCPLCRNCNDPVKHRSRILQGQRRYIRGKERGAESEDTRSIPVPLDCRRRLVPAVKGEEKQCK